MLKVECESCKAPYQVDERRVPPTGLKMRCPKCGHTFVVTNPNAPAPVAAPAAPKVEQKRTMVGVGAVPSPGVPKPPDSLPAALGHIDELEIPSLSGLPSPVKNPVAPFAPPRPGAPAAAAPPAGFGEIDLPAPVADLPSAKPRPLPHGFGGRVGGVKDSPDLPAPKRGGAAPPFGSIDADLPALASDLPMPVQNLPAVSHARGAGGGGGGFGDIDLPAVVNDLPSVQGGEMNLPMTANNLPMAQNNLPMAQNNLPMAQPRGANLPMPAAHQNLLPQTAPNQNVLPTIGDFGELDLPRAQPMGMQLPSVGQQKPPSDFGELDLPGPDRSAGGSAPPPFGALPEPGRPVSVPPSAVQSVPPGPSARPGPPMPSGPPAPQGRAVGGMGFGEVDLGGGGGIDLGSVGTEVRLGGPQGAPAGAAGTLAPEQEARAKEVAQRRARTVVVKKPSAAPKIIVAAGVLFLLGGSLLQLTSVGAFGNLWFSDKINASEYARLAQQGAEKARKRMGSDTFSEARAAADELAQARAQRPRARALAAYAALAQYMTDLRFGKDATLDAKASQWLTEIPPNADPKVTPVAQAAQAALAGDLPKARKLLDGAQKSAGGDPIGADIAFVRGEVELLAKDGQAAVAAFKKAADAAPTARAHFGLARAYELASDTQKAKDEVNLALKASPNDAGALILRAKIGWNRERDELGASRDLTAVTDGAAKGTASAAELARAHALRGWVQLQRDRGADARAEFEQALKLDARSVSALVGQGEVLYQDGRFAEALGRFDTALQTDALSVEAIVGDAKTQIKLERLADAKKQLKAARERFPRDWRLALWLGRAEEALGDKKAAEDQYLGAIDLADTSDPDAITAYSALATLLAQEGRTEEAEAKLKQAQERLPESVTLSLAFGEIAQAQGKFDRAIPYYEKCLERDPNDLSCRFRLGQVLRKMHQIDKASAELDKVYAASPDFPDLALERGLLYEASGEVQKALELFKSAQMKEPNNLDVQLRVAASYVLINQPDEAIPILQKVMEQRQNSAEVNYFLGRAYFEKGPSEERRTMQFLRKAVDLDPFRPEYHLYVAWAANSMANPDLNLARTEAEKALALDRMAGDAYWQLGMVENKLSQVDDAIRHLKRALELKPDRAEAHAELAKAYDQKNDVATELAEWKKAIDGSDKNPEWRYRYGKLLLDKGQAAEAGKHLLYATTEAEKDAKRPGWLNDAEFWAGEALRKSGKRLDAIERYNQFLQHAEATNPSRREALAALQTLGAPYDPRGGL